MNVVTITGTNGTVETFENSHVAGIVDGHLFIVTIEKGEPREVKGLTFTNETRTVSYVPLSEVAAMHVDNDDAAVYTDEDVYQHLDENLKVPA